MKKSDKKKVSLWERYLTKEIGIEFKACLYFFGVTTVHIGSALG